MYRLNPTTSTTKHGEVNALLTTAAIDVGRPGERSTEGAGRRGRGSVLPVGRLHGKAGQKNDDYFW